jgi:hypothetical protein
MKKDFVAHPSYWQTNPMPKSSHKLPPVLRIVACDRTGGWNLDDYSPQKGHTLGFETNLCDEQIEKIVWTFDTGNGTLDTSTEKRVCRVFTKLVDGVALPGEGFVSVFVAVTTTSNHCLCARREILIVPAVKCELVFEDDYHIEGDTQCVQVTVNGLCEALRIGNPFQGVEGYACGGACVDRCPEYELRMTLPHETRLFSYGKHCVCAEVGICESRERQSLPPPPVCVPLYANNFLGEHARYPPVHTCFCIVPRNLTLQVFHTPGQRWHKRFFIHNLSQHMLKETDGGSVEWRIFDQRGKTYWREVNQCATLCYEFRQLGYYCVEATIHIGKACKPATTRVYLRLDCHCDAEKDVAVYAQPALADLLPESCLL